MKLSVIIPNHNDTVKMIERQIDAVFRQEWADGFEVVVIDNRSTDDSLAVLTRCGDRFPHLQVVSANERAGAGYARNCGVRASTGEALVFCDADDQVAPGWLAAMGAALREHNFVAARLDLDKLNDPQVVRGQVHPQSRGLQRMPYPPYLPHAAGATLGVKRWLHDAVGGFDETFRFVQDTHYCLRVQLAGHPLHFVPGAVVHYRMRHKTRDAFRQAQRWGRYSVRLYAASRRLGTPPLPHPWRGGFEAWCKLLYGLPALRAEQNRRRWICQLGYRTGRLLGCIRHRTLAPSLVLLLC